MKEYKVLVGNRTRVVKDLAWGKEIARMMSRVNFRATVVDGNEIVARYEWGKEI